MTGVALALLLGVFGLVMGGGTLLDILYAADDDASDGEEDFGGRAQVEARLSELTSCSASGPVGRHVGEARFSFGGRFRSCVRVIAASGASDVRLAAFTAAGMHPMSVPGPAPTIELKLCPGERSGETFDIDVVVMSETDAPFAAVAAFCMLESARARGAGR